MRYYFQNNESSKYITINVKIWMKKIKNVHQLLYYLLNTFIKRVLLRFSRFLVEKITAKVTIHYFSNYTFGIFKIFFCKIEIRVVFNKPIRLNDKLI